MPIIGDEGQCSESLLLDGEICQASETGSGRTCHAYECQRLHSKSQLLHNEGKICQFHKLTRAGHDACEQGQNPFQTLHKLYALRYVKTA